MTTNSVLKLPCWRKIVGRQMSPHKQTHVGIKHIQPRLMSGVAHMKTRLDGVIRQGLITLNITTENVYTRAGILDIDLAEG